MKVLLADDNTERAGALACVLAADPSLLVVRLQPGVSLTEGVTSWAPDIVIVPRP